MSIISVLSVIARNYKQYAPTIAAVASGIAMIASKHYSEGLATIFQALAMVFGGASLVRIQSAVSKPPSN